VISAIDPTPPIAGSARARVGDSTARARDAFLGVVARFRIAEPGRQAVLP
jgi:hypothetical protein